MIDLRDLETRPARHDFELRCPRCEAWADQLMILDGGELICRGCVEATMGRKKLTKIEAARSEVGKVEGEVDSLRQQAHELREELLRLNAERTENPFDTAIQAKIKDVEDALRQLDLATPPPGGRLGDRPKPGLMYRLERAQADYDRVRSERYHLGRRIEELESLERRLGDMAKIEEVMGFLLTTFTTAREFPPTVNERAFRGMVGWAKKTRGELATLPALRQRLKEYGPDPDYTLSRWPSETPWKVTRARAAG